MAKEASRANANLINAEADRLRTNSQIDAKTVPRGQILGWLAVVSVLALAGFALYLDRPWLGLIFGVGGLGLMAANVVPSLMASQDSKIGNESVNPPARSDD